MALRPKQQLPLSGRLVLDPGPQGIASPSLNGAGATVRLDTQAAIAPAEGMAKIGEGLQNLGSATSALAEKVTEARSITGQNKAAEIMAKANADIANGTATEPDAKKWGGISDGALNTAEQQLQALDLDPKTREIVNHKFAMNKYDVQQGLGTQAIRKDFGDARDAIKNTLRHAAITNDSSLDAETKRIATAGPHPFFRQDEITAIDDINNEIRKSKAAEAQIGIVIGAAHADPTATLKALDDPKSKIVQGMTPQTLAQARNIAEAEKRGQTYDIGHGLSDRMALPPGDPNAITDDSQIDGFDPKNPLVTPSMRQTAKDALAERKTKGFAQKMQVEGPKLASAMWTRIDSWDPKGAHATDEYFKLQSEAGLLPAGPLRTEVQNKLEGKFKGTDVKAGDDRLQYGETVLTGMMNAGYFGAFDNDTKVAYPYVDPKTGKAETRYKVEGVRNPEQYATALGLKSDMGAALHDYISAHPKATIPEVKKWIFEHQEDTTLTGIFGVLQRGLQAARTINATTKAEGPRLETPAETTPGEAPPKKGVSGDDAPLPQNEGKNPDGRASNKETALSQDDLPSSPGGPESELLPMAPADIQSDQSVPTRPITDKDIKKAKGDIQVVDPDTGEWKQIPRSDARKKAWLVPK